MQINKNINFRWQIVLVFILVILTAFWGSCSKKPQKVYRVGIISGVDTFIDMADGFKTKMAELGYIEGGNITYDLQKLNNDPEGDERVARKFVADKVDLIFAFPTEPALAAQEAAKGTNIPIVFGFAGLQGNKLVESVFKPGGNITGVRFPGPELTAKRLEILHEFVPSAKRIGIIYDPDYPNADSALEALRPTASSIGLLLVEIPAVSAADIRAALKKRTESANVGMDAILIMPDILCHTLEGFAEITKFADKHKLPIGGGHISQADTGAMFGYSPDNFEMGELAATLADKILKGTPAGTIMVITPPAHLRINYKRASELGLSVPEGLLNRADEIIR
jgi:putative ABC transport system substrate-binding protein